MPTWNPRDTERARALRLAATPAEKLLWRYLSRSQTGAKFSRQMPVGPFYADFLCRELRLVIECDGISHDRDPQGDEIRDRWMQANGYRIMRFTNGDVLGNVEGVAQMIALEVLRLRG
jgi:BirA family biotin operon repressor/biotin-[acetyl-CoA-carboxylase] ligase